MGLTRLRAFLRRHRRVALDTCIFVYQLEEVQKYIPLTQPVFEWLQEPGAQGITSTITMTELLVQPYREEDMRRVDGCFALLSRIPNLVWVDSNLTIADVAAKLRAKHRLKMPDALQAATAICSHAPGLLTNDPMLQRVDELDVLILDDLL